MPLSLPSGARVPDRAVWLNGRIVRGEEAALSVFDRGARDGGGLFETLPLPTLFGAVAGVAFAAALILLGITPWLRKLMGGVR